MASSTNVDVLFQHDFFLVINDKRYRVKVAKEGTEPRGNVEFVCICNFKHRDQF